MEMQHRKVEVNANTEWYFHLFILNQLKVASEWSETEIAFVPLIGHLWCSDDLDLVIDIILPRFMSSCTELRAIIAQQHDEVKDMKAKVLAGAVTVGIGGLQLVLKRFFNS